MATHKYSTASHIAVAPNYFGRGFDVDEAKRNLRAQGATLQQFVVYKMPAGARDVYVNDFGTLRWLWDDDADTSGVPEIVASRGVDS